VVRFEQVVPKISVVSVSKDGKRVCIGTQQDFIRVWDIEQGITIWQSTLFGDPFIKVLTFSSQGDCLAAATEHGEIVLSNMNESADEVRIIKQVDISRMPVAFHPDPRALDFIEGENRKEKYLSITKIPSGLKTLALRRKDTTTLATSPDRRFVVYEFSHKAKVVDLQNKSDIATLTGTESDDILSPLAISGDGKLVATTLYMGMYNAVMGHGACCCRKRYNPIKDNHAFKATILA